MSDAAPRTWTPAVRIIDPRDLERRQRRRRRHGRERPGSVPMAAGVRSSADAQLGAGAAELRGAWGDWIDSAARWDWFTTHTFVVDVGPDPALARFDRWLARLAEAIRQKSRCSPELQSACAVEWTHRNRVHLHAIVSGRGLSDHGRTRWEHRWQGLDRACGMARVLPATERASAYLAKHCGKGGVVVVRGRFSGWPASHNARSSQPESRPGTARG